MNTDIQVVERLVKENARLQQEIKRLNKRIDELLYGKQEHIHDYAYTKDDIVEFR